MKGDFVLLLSTWTRRALCLSLISVSAVGAPTVCAEKDGYANQAGFANQAGPAQARVHEMGGLRWLEIPAARAEGRRTLVIGREARAGRIIAPSLVFLSRDAQRLAVPQEAFCAELQLCSQLGGGSWGLGPVIPMSSISGELIQTGDVVIAEFMADPILAPDNKGEWIELENRLPHRVNLEGWRLRDLGGESHTLNAGGAGIWVARGARLLLGRSDDLNLNGGVPVDHVISGFSLANIADELFLERPGGELSDAVVYSSAGSWPVGPGMAASLSPSVVVAGDADEASAWCGVPWGTPGVMNAECP